MVASVHQTFVKDTMPYSKHMCDFMTHDSHRSKFDQRVIYLIFFHLEKPLIISGKREDPSSIPDARQSKHKIPFFSGVEVSHWNPDHAETICW